MCDSCRFANIMIVEGKNNNKNINKQILFCVTRAYKVGQAAC